MDEYNRKYDEQLERIKQGEKVVLGEHWHLEYLDGYFFWVEELEPGKISRCCINETAVKLHLYHCDIFRSNN